MLATLERWTPLAALAGGAVFVIVVVVAALDPNSPIYFGFLIPFVLLSMADVGLAGRLGGRGGAWVRQGGQVAGIAGVVLAVLFVISSLQPYDMASPIVLAFIGVFVIWAVANLAMAVGLIRSGAMSPIGAWLMILGAIGGIVVAVIGGSNPPAWAILPVGLFGLGWAVIGWAPEVRDRATA